MAKKGLMIDYYLCTGCHSCEVSCKLEKHLPTGQYGIKLNDGDADAWQIDDSTWEYKWIPVPTQLCDLCAERVESGKTPACVLQCCAHCLYYGDVSELAKKMDGLDRKAVLFTQ